MAEIFSEGSAKLHMQRRPTDENPFDRRCKPHLQRTCGVCVHYQGVSAALGGGTNTCAYFEIQVSACRGAGKCHRWERKAVTHA